MSPRFAPPTLVVLRLIEWLSGVPPKRLRPPPICQLPNTPAPDSLVEVRLAAAERKLINKTQQVGQAAGHFYLALTWHSLTDLLRPYVSNG